MTTHNRLRAKPDCFTQEQWEYWLDTSSYSETDKLRVAPNPIDYACQDCKPDYKERMMRAGRCSWPCVEFFMMPDGSMEGRRISIAVDRGYAEGKRIIPIRLEGARTAEPDCSID